jgi:hypothetical protein
MGLGLERVSVVIIASPTCQTGQINVSNPFDQVATTHETHLLSQQRCR